jgi:hypothetical protein
VSRLERPPDSEYFLTPRLLGGIQVAECWLPGGQSNHCKRPAGVTTELSRAGVDVGEQPRHSLAANHANDIAPVIEFADALESKCHLFQSNAAPEPARAEDF